MAVGSLAHILDQFEGLSEVPLRGSPLRGCIISGKSGLARQRPQGMRGQEAAAQAPITNLEGGSCDKIETKQYQQSMRHQPPNSLLFSLHLRGLINPLRKRLPSRQHLYSLKPISCPSQTIPHSIDTPQPLEFRTLLHASGLLRTTPRLSTPSNYSRYTAEALLSILDNSAFKQRPMTLPKHNPTSEDSVNAARFRAKHALMHWTGYKDEGCQYHSSSLINQNRAPPNNHCSYCDERSHYTYVCKIYQADQRYLQALAAEDQPPPASPLLSPTSPPEMTPETSPKSTGWTYLEKGKEKAIQRSRIFII
ncbi:hypothetical protein BGX38DRAFT_1272896 [Terfezia claveryi]|nr:hypothetical protein BGX38DRAFT_1272896 [Terfezia claveryi]